jgi:hypothetical protein
MWGQVGGNNGVSSCREYVDAWNLPLDNIGIINLQAPTR